MRISTASPSRLGFTLMEVVMVVVVVGILSVAATPAFLTLSASREGAAADEVRRLLQMARGVAMSSGRPTGLACDADSAVGPVQIETLGASPVELRTPLGERAHSVSIAGLYPGVGISSALLGSGDTGAVTFWFAADGTPHSRTLNGQPLSPWTSDGSITLSGGTVVTVRRVSGVIE